ncbi:class E sortase [Raineyella fluvialis]|uniref:Class E sortase n=1 Tax=Raineyella fluvialis TaxID=2662261 RepID=A0A5Q2FH93_9ACTN|nr:class E sortase [Raineyella fluvialis]
MGLVVGIVLIVVGLVVLGWFGYQYIGTTIVSQQGYSHTTTQLEQSWSGGGAASTTGSGDVRADGSVVRIPGAALGIMRVPAFGESWAVPVLDGTDQTTLAKGLGWYENTNGPGQVGNFAVAGHVVTHGQPFRRLQELKPGATIEVETREAVYTYVMDSSATVKDTDTWVLDPVPGHPGEKATDKLITLTTCADLFRSPDRYIVFGHLVSTRAK